MSIFLLLRNILLTASVILSASLSLPAFAGETKSVDAVLIIDSSGSMKKTDPLRLRIPAAKLFVSLLLTNDRIGIVSFSDAGKTLINLSEAKNKSARNRLFRAIDKVNSLGLHTNIYDGIKKGFDILESPSSNEKMLILMSDGQMDTGDTNKDKSLISDLKTTLLPEISKAGVKVYTIAFTEGSDQALLEDIALKTGGSYKLAKTDKDLHIVFSSIFEKIKSPDTLPLKDNSFMVDQDVREMTLLITKKDPGTAIAITDPSAKKLTAKKHSPDTQWFESNTFDMITMNQPAAGQWNIKFNAEEGNKVFIVTNLNLSSSFNQNFVNQGANLKIDAWFEKDNEVLKLKEVLEHIKISANVKTPDGRITELMLSGSGAAGNIIPPDGVYSAQFQVDQAGDYVIRLTAGAETFKREKEFTFKALKSPETKPAAIAAPKKTETKKENAFSWTSVLIKLGIINITVIAFVMIVYFIKIFFIKIRKRK